MKRLFGNIFFSVIFYFLTIRYTIAVPCLNNYIILPRPGLKLFPKLGHFQNRCSTCEHPCTNLILCDSVHQNVCPIQTEISLDPNICYCNDHNPVETTYEDVKSTTKIKKKKRKNIKTSSKKTKQKKQEKKKKYKEKEEEEEEEDQEEEKEEEEGEINHGEEDEINQEEEEEEEKIEKQKTKKEKTATNISIPKKTNVISENTKSTENNPKTLVE